jgi:putative hydrolase of the HAD superfamily
VPERCFEPERVKGVLFDCYDTLINIRTDERDIQTYRFLSNWLIYQGVRITPERLRDTYKERVREEMEKHWERYPDVRVEEIFAGICADYMVMKASPKQLGARVAQAFRAASLRELHAYEKSHKLLDIFHDKRKGVVSNGQRIFSEREMRMLGFYDRFDFVLFSSDIMCKKPNPRIYMTALDHLKMEPEDVLFIGDSYENDIIPPLKIGMQALFVDEAWRYFGT